MPLIEDFCPTPDVRIGIWKITEPLEELLSAYNFSTEEKAELSLIRSVPLATEWAASRSLLKQMLLPAESILSKDDCNKPYFPGSSLKLSLSHTHEYATVILSSCNAGIDIQCYETKIGRIAHKFISPEEWQYIPEEKEERLSYIHLFWSAKEAMYKLYGKKKLDFREHMFLHPFALAKHGHLQGRISKEDYSLEMPVHYSFREDFLLVYAVEVRG